MLELLFGGDDSEAAVVDYYDYNDYDRSGEVTFDDAYVNFMEGGGHLGLGAAMLVGSAWTGIALTPSLVLDSLQPDDGVNIA
jgi:hypothetical protein